MNSQDFLIMNAVGAGGFLLWYLVSRGGSRRPTVLNLKAKDSAPPVVNPLPPESAVIPPATTPSYSTRNAPLERPKNLNIMFNYNGHSWDAYEVLGVPAGANLKLVTDAYQKAVRNSEKESLEFLETAYLAILNRKN